MILNRYEIFLKTAEIGNITKTAEILHYTQAGISHAIAALEKETGFSLLARSASGVTLTENGKRLLPYIQTLVNDQHGLSQAIYDINAQAEADGRAHRGSLDTALWDEMAARDKVSGSDAANAASTSLFFGLANTFGGSHDEADDLARMRTLQPSSENVDMLLAQASDTYVLDPEAIEHLDDVFGVLATAEPVVLGAFIAAVLTAVGVGCASGRRTFGTVLLCAGLGTIAVFAILGIWAAIDFEGLFAVFHSLFFAQGSWVFSADSLLITMYPEPFWIGMGAIWLATTIAVSAVSAIAGFALRHA